MLLRNPHRNFITAQVLYKWSISVIYAQSYSIYGILQKIFSEIDKRNYGLNKFLRMVRDRWVPPCNLVRTMNISPISGKEISFYHKCYICESDYQRLGFNLPDTTCNHYCVRCDKWMHIQCQFLYRTHVPTPLNLVLKELEQQKTNKKRK
jgi:hypothetical protein